ncbi:MAG TPA: trypsin-like peptidase domain-containing protein [Pseudonocardia sp.]|jgi:putative serine protease PepD|nr:trypsin-like peptidase domain-containing protein [Pseudonocardia sp.]
MEKPTEGERGWGLAEATRKLLESANPAEPQAWDQQGWDPQIDRAIRSFVAQPAGSVALDDTLADQLVILAHHFSVDEAYFLDPAVARSSGTRRRDPVRAPGTSSAEEPRALAGGEPVTGRQSGEARRPRRVAVAAGLVGALAGGGLAGYGVGVTTTEPSSSAAPTPAAHHVEASVPLQQVVGKSLTSVVQVRVRAGNGESTGSGVVLSPNGMLLVSDHVIASAARAGQLSIVLPDGTPRFAHVVGRDPASDLAVVAADHVGGLTPVELGDSNSLRVGERVVAVGPLLNRGGAITSGVVNAIGRATSPEHEGAKTVEPVTAIRTDAAINPANSGAPLVDPHGLVVGVETVVPGGAGVAESGGFKLGTAIPINQAARIADRLIESKTAIPTILGVRVGAGSPLSALNRSRGAAILAVSPGSPASDAALTVGDVVSEVNGRPVASGEELIVATRNLAPGKLVTLRLSDGRVTRLSVDRPPAVAVNSALRQGCGRVCPTSAGSPREEQLEQLQLPQHSLAQHSLAQHSLAQHSPTHHAAKLGSGESSTR